MASIGFIAPLIRAALAKLEADYASHVAAFNAEPANTVDLTVPSLFVFGAEATFAGAYPYVEAAAVDGTLGPFSIGEAGNPSEGDSTPRIQIVTWVEGASGEVSELYETALGYARVTIEILSRHGSFGVDADLSNDADAIVWRVDPIPSELDDLERTVLRWKMPASVSFKVEAIDRWQ